MSTPRRIVAIAVLQVVAVVGVLGASGWTIIATDSSRDDAVEQVHELQARLDDYQRTNRQLAAAQTRLSELIDDRGSVVAHMICVDRLIAAYTVLVTADPATHSDAIRQAATRLLAGLDPDSGVCPPILEN